LVTLLLLSVSMVKVDAQQTKIYVNPKSSTVSDIGDVFTVKVTIADVTDLYGFELKLGYNTTILDIEKTTIQPFLNEPNYVIFDEMNEDEGWYLLAVTSWAPAAPKSGGGTLAEITFKATGIGNCTLDLYDVKLANSTAGLIPHQAINGEVTTLEQPDDSSEPFSLVNVAIVIVVAVSFVAALYYVKKKIL
jgi:hypothetical protein